MGVVADPFVGALVALGPKAAGAAGGGTVIVGIVGASLGTAREPGRDLFAGAMQKFSGTATGVFEPL